MVSRRSKPSSGIRTDRAAKRSFRSARRNHAPDKAASAAGQLAKAQKIAALGSWEIDFGTGRLWVSDEMRRVFGWAPEVRPSIALMLDVVHPDDRATVENWLSPPHEGRPRAEECFFRVLRGDAKPILLYGRCSVEPGSGSGQELLIGTVQDMTRLVAVEREAH